MNMRRRQFIWSAVSSAAIATAAGSTREGDKLIGKLAPPLKLEHWLNSRSRLKFPAFAAK